MVSKQPTSEQLALMNTKWVMENVTKSGTTGVMGMFADTTDEYEPYYFFMEWQDATAAADNNVYSMLFYYGTEDYADLYGLKCSLGATKASPGTTRNVYVKHDDHLANL